LVPNSPSSGDIIVDVGTYITESPVTMPTRVVEHVSETSREYVSVKMFRVIKAEMSRRELRHGYTELYHTVVFRGKGRGRVEARVAGANTWPSPRPKK
jgi:hypothetical protein